MEQMNKLLTTKLEGMKFLLRALRYRNYRLFFLGQGVSLIGSWMQTIAISWLTYRLTNSAFLLGMVAFMSQIPVIIFSPFAGVLADRLNRKNILIVTQTFLMLGAFILAILCFLKIIQVWHIIFLSTLLGLTNALDIPTRQAFVVDMVEDKKDLGNAIALNSFILNSARLIGPSIAGILIAAVGEGICFLLNGISFLAIIFALFAMKIHPANKNNHEQHIFEDLKDGLLYAFHHIQIRYILLLVTLVSLMGMSYAVLMPVFAKEVLGGGASTLGFLMGATGLGAIVGAAYLASRTNILELPKTISLAGAIFGLGLIAFSFSRYLWLSLILMLCVGFTMIAQMVSSNILIQNLTADDKRGRVMSLYTISFMGMVPFGSLLAGSLASKIGAPHALIISGLSCVMGSLFFSLKISSFRTIHQKN
jgi:MFS family permease